MRPGSRFFIAPVLTVALAVILWAFSFSLDWGNFWIKISFSAATLAAISLLVRAPEERRPRLSLKDAVIGLAAAAALYGIFFLGKTISTALFPFATGQIDSIYHQGPGMPLSAIFLILLLITGPCEEIYWRGYLQKRLSRDLGPWTGLLLTATCYTLVHLVTLNFMLIGAAAVAGLFWGLLYLYLGRLGPVLVSHSLWSAFIFAIAPL